MLLTNYRTVALENSDIRLNPAMVICDRYYCANLRLNSEFKRHTVSPKRSTVKVLIVTDVA